VAIRDFDTPPASSGANIMKHTALRSIVPWMPIDTFEQAANTQALKVIIEA
jgi:hypothetical protein